MTYNTIILPDNPLLTDEKIQELLAIPKTISEKTPAQGYKEENSNKRCDLRLKTASDDGDRFNIFIRQHSIFIEGFSLGLRFQTKSKTRKTITLVRYNGLHGEYSRNPDGHFVLPHIHRITAQELASGSNTPQESHREITDRYSTFEQALRIFFEDIGVQNYADYFPEALQPRLFDEHR